MSALPATMTCVEISKPGGPEVLAPTTRPVPQPRDGEILIKVAAVGVNREIIVDGENSFLAATHADWVGKLSRLLSDEALRARMAVAGRRTIEERYSLRVTSRRRS